MSKKFNNPATVDKANKVAKTDDSPLYVQLNKLDDPCAEGEDGDACRAAAKKLAEATTKLAQYETPFGSEASPCLQGDAACQA